jgi:hypothetical protein
MQFLANDCVLDSTWVVVIGSDDAIRTARFVPGATCRRVALVAVAVFHILAPLASSFVGIMQVIIAISPVTV